MSLQREDENMEAAGVMYRTSDGKTLLLRRANGSSQPGYWGLPGGHLEGDETPWDAARRESVEETGIDPPIGGVLGSMQMSPDFTMFVVLAPDMMPVTLNHEHDAFGWFSADNPPEPMMPGIEL